MHTYSEFMKKTSLNEFLKTVKDSRIAIFLNPSEKEILHITNCYGYSFFELKVNKLRCCIFYSSHFNLDFINAYNNKFYYFGKNQTVGSFFNSNFGTKKVEILRHCHITGYCGTSYNNLQGKYYTFN